MRDWILTAIAAILAILYINAAILTGAFEPLKECVYGESDNATD
jgi:hypothetical protein